MTTKCRVCGCDIDDNNRVSAVVNRRGKTFVRIFKICKPCRNENSKDRYHANPEKAKAQHKKWADRPGVRKELADYAKEYRRKNPEKCRLLKQSWRAENPDKNRKMGRDYYWRHKDKPWRIVCRRTRARLGMAIRHRGTSKYGNTMELVGCDREDLVRHIESTFAAGMSWENHGSWEIDHIIPVVAFDLTDPEQQRKCFHFTNLQALWVFDNRSKGSKIQSTFTKS